MLESSMRLQICHQSECQGLGYRRSVRLLIPTVQEDYTCAGPELRGGIMKRDSPSTDDCGSGIKQCADTLYYYH